MYVLVSMTMLFLICLWHSVLSQLQQFGYSSDVQYWADKYGLYTFGVIYVIFHIIYIARISVKVGIGDFLSISIVLWHKLWQRYWYRDR